MQKLTCGQKLLLLRRQKKLSQRDLAKKLDINFTSIVKYEKDVYLPNTEILLKFSDFFNLPIDYLVKDDRDLTFIQDDDLLKLTAQADQLPAKEKNSLKNLIKSYLADNQP